MKDKLQEFIQANRAAFDDHAPPAQVWQGLERTLERLQTAGAAEQFVLRNRALLDTGTPPDGLWARIENEMIGQNSAAPCEDPLEDFIAQNRVDFDALSPGLRVWAEVEKTLAGPARPSAKIVQVHWSRHLLRSAAALALLLTGIGLGIWYAGAGHAQTAGMALSEVSAEYAELEDYYQRDIAVKQEKLVSFAGNRGADVQEDMLQLDGVMTELRQELANVPPGNREQIVRAMIENYKAKAAILERVLERVEGQDQQPKTNNSLIQNDTTTI